MYVMPIVYIIDMFTTYCIWPYYNCCILPEMPTFACWFILLISVANRVVDTDQARQNIWTWSESILFGKA